MSRHLVDLAAPGKEGNRAEVVPGEICDRQGKKAVGRGRSLVSVTAAPGKKVTVGRLFLASVPLR
jgi:hypothetical protein